MKIDLKSVPTDMLIEEIQRRCVKPKFFPVWAETSLIEVAKALGVSVHDLANNLSREPSAHWPRSIAITVLRKNKERSYQQIASLWNLNHATAMAAERRVLQRMETDLAFNQLVSPLFI